jgi:hypothetical protein
MGIEPISSPLSALGSAVHLPSLFQPPPQGYRLGGAVHPYGLLTTLRLELAARTPWFVGVATDPDIDARLDSKLETKLVSNGHTAAPTGKSIHVLIVGCGVAGLVATISLKKGILGRDCRGGDGILPCKPSQNGLPSLPLHPKMPVIRSTRYLTRAANSSEQASASSPTLRASSAASASRKPIPC